ncbi:MAG TPA: hypothetical protein VI455_16345 [Terriglobia bacterium]
MLLKADRADSEGDTAGTLQDSRPELLEGTRPGFSPTTPTKGGAFSRLITAASILALVLLAGAGIRRIELPPWFSELLVSIIVVTIVHLLDRYVFMNETRSELEEMSGRIVRDVSGKTDNAFRQSTIELSRSLGDRSAQLLSETKASLNDILTQQSSSLEAMQSSCIRSVYASRREAARAIADALENPRNTDVRILGISLNDFLLGGEPALNEAWQVLRRYIEGDAQLPKGHQGLRIRVLIIDPTGLGAQLRSYAETQRDQTVVGRLDNDVQIAAQALQRLERLAGQNVNDTKVSFQCRLYRLAPIMFLCHVDEVCFVEQYHFWTKRLNETPIPVLQYERQAAANSSSYPMHEELGEHFDLIWDFSGKDPDRESQEVSISVSDYLDHAAVGIDQGAGDFGLVNIFASSNDAGTRMSWLLKNAKKRVLVQGISLKSFFTGGKLADRMFELIAAGTVDVKALIIDPDCEQATYRSYRERLLQPQGRGISYDEYKQSNKHQESRLVIDTRATIDNIKGWVSDLAAHKQDNNPWKCNLEVRLYDSAPVCFMLAADDHVLVEPYNYGKLGSKRGGWGAPRTLGTDMPLFEFRSEPSVLYEKRSDPLRRPFELQVDHFEFAFSVAKRASLSSSL